MQKTQDTRSLILLTVIVVLFIVVAALYAVYTPPWQAPDEPAHFNYIAQIALGEGCPVIAAGDWDAAYLEDLKADQFPEGADLSAIEYEDHQPPFYYLLGSLVFRLTGGDLLALRLLSVAFGAGVVISTYLALARLLPERKTLALAAAAFVAFLPQHVAILASVNNDSLAELLLGMLTVVAITYLGNPVSVDEDGKPTPLDESMRPHAAALGGLVGMAFLTKLTIYLPAVMVAAAAILLRWRKESRPVKWLAGQVLWAAGMALAFGAIWWVRNALVYGWPDIFGLAAHNAVVVGQLRTAEHIATIGRAAYLRDFFTVTYHSFWGQFGWMGVPMPRRVYLLTGVFTAWELIGLAGALLFRADAPRALPIQRAGGWVLAAAGLGTLVNYVYYNTGFVQFQGRYLFPALIPVGALAALGGWGWTLILTRITGISGKSKLAWLPLIAVGWLPLLAIWALFKYVVPNLG